MEDNKDCLVNALLKELATIDALAKLCKIEMEEEVKNETLNLIYHLMHTFRLHVHSPLLDNKERLKHLLTLMEITEGLENAK